MKDIYPIERFGIGITKTKSSDGIHQCRDTVGEKQMF